MLRALGVTSLKLNKVSLPKQPIPDLKKTSEKYLRSLKPLLNEREYCKSEKIVNHFISRDGPGPILHKKLQERFENTENWLYEWWTREVYLANRLPLIYHNNGTLLAPSQKVETFDEMHQLAARVIEGICKFDILLKSGEMHQEMMGNKPLDMHSYGMILGSHRQPDRNIENLLHTDLAHHIIVISNNRFFKLNFLNDFKLFTENQLKASIKDIMKRSSDPGKPVGILTGTDRDTWAENHELLKEIGTNRKILKDIESSLFVLCLDKNLPSDAFKSKNNESVRIVQSMTGFSSCTNAGNRWHDKTVQYIVSSDGFFMAEFEHTAGDAAPGIALHDFVVNHVTSKLNMKSEDAESFPLAEELKFQLNDELEIAIDLASITVDELAENMDVECFTFEDFGNDEMKKWKLSPDSFIQMALQVTLYKLKKKPLAHCEAADLRRFYNSRTEWIRSTSSESIEFAKLFTSKSDNNEKKKALIDAINVHKKAALEAVLGEGIDNYFYGLGMIIKEEKMEVPEFYKDVGWIKSTHHSLVSSQIALKTPSFMCLTPGFPDAYSCGYNPRKSEIIFTCVSYKDNAETCTKTFAETLQDTLREMKKIAQ